jgi:chromosome segregation ATPase
VIPNPDPSIITSDAIDRRVLNSERVVTARIEGMEKAVNVFQADLTRVPTQLDRAIAGLGDLQTARLDGAISVIKQRLDGMDRAIELFQKFTDQTPQFVRDQVTHLRELHEAGFESIRTQFTLLKQATEQLDLANKTAIAAALQAQKESAGETQKSSQAAIAKSENSTAEAIKALTSTFNSSIADVRRQADELKSRLDRGEGKTSQSDPAVAAALQQMSAAIGALQTGANQQSGHSQGLTQLWGYVVALAGAAVAAAALLMHH